MEQLHLLYIGTVWPEPVSSAAGVKTLSDIRALLDAGWMVSFASPGRLNHFSGQLEALGVIIIPLALNDEQSAQQFADLKPDVAVFDRFMMEEKFSWMIRSARPDCLLVLDTIDLHSLRAARKHAALEQGQGPGDVKRCVPKASDEILIRELASILRSDLSLLVSDFELELLVDQFGVPRNKLLRHSMMYPEVPETPARFDPRKAMVTIGNFRHAPNKDAFNYLHQTLWPAIREKLPEVDLHVYGSYPPKEVMAATDRDAGFVVKGPCKDQYKTLKKYHLALAPLRFGAGVKGKISDSWFCNVPVVTTRIGAEGMGDDALAWGGLIADTTASFVDAVVRLYREEKLWLSSLENGRRILRDQFNTTRQSAELISTFRSMVSNLGAIRETDVAGQLLWHQSLRSTEYFSRWIAEKNRKT